MAIFNIYRYKQYFQNVLDSSDLRNLFSHLVDYLLKPLKKYPLLKIPAKQMQASANCFIGNSLVIYLSFNAKMLKHF